MSLKFSTLIQKAISRSVPHARQGRVRVFVGTDRGALLPLSTLNRHVVKKAQSQALAQETGQWMEQSKLVEHPFDMGTLLLLYESNVTFARCVNQIAVDAAGLGWDLVLNEFGSENEPERLKLHDFLKKPNEGESLRHLLKALVVDAGVTGNFYVEVALNNAGEVSKLYRMPAHTIWQHRSKTKYCQRRGQRKKWFAKWGLEDDSGKRITIDPKTGKEKELSISEAANYVIHLKIFYPKSDYYGAPPILPAVGDVLTLIGIRDFNLSFFDNYGIPAYVVFVKGQIEDAEANKIRDFMNTEIKGADQQHKTMVMGLEEGTEVDFQPVSVAIKEGSFRLYRQILREDVLSAYSMPPYRIGIPVVGTLGGNIAEELMKVYKSSMVEPWQTDLEDIINDQILEQGLMIENYKVKFTDLDIDDESAQIEMDNARIQHGHMTPNQALIKRGERPYPGGDTYYMGSNLIPVGEEEPE